MGAVLHTLQQDRQRAAQPDRRCIFTHARAGARVHEGATARRQHDRRSRQQAAQNHVFAPTEFRLAIFLEQIGDGTACRAFDFFVRIHEFQVQPRCEQAPDGGLSRPHEPYEHDAASLWHGGDGMSAMAKRIKVEGDEQGRGVVVRGRGVRRRGRIG